MTFDKTEGSRAEVWHGTAKRTSGNLTKKDLMKNKHGRIVSKQKHFTAKKEKRLVKAGFLTKKGHFGFIKDTKSHKHKSHKKTSSHKRGRPKGSHNKHHKMKGGMALGGNLSPTAYHGQGVKTSGVDLQFVAGNSN